MFTKYRKDHLVMNSPTCGEIHDIITQNDGYAIGLAISLNIKPTQGHYHLTFDETYFVLDGNITLEVYDPVAEQKTSYYLNPNELCVITKGLHHKIKEASMSNRLCIISYPPFHADDEHLSQKL